MRLGSSGQLNITLLFGFSPRLPFPETYAEFKAVVDAAKSLEYNLAEPGVRKSRVSIAVGAAVIPQQARDNVRLLDVGARQGSPACALRRLATYATQPDSQVDVMRVGMEDTRYAVDTQGGLRLADNCALAETAIDELSANGVQLELDHEAICERLSLHLVRDDLLSEQRRRPLGRAS